MIDTIKNILQNDSNVLFGYLFGSYANKTYTSSSDVDIALYLKNNSFDNTLDINFKLSKALNKNVDNVILNSIKNIYLTESILRDGIVLKDDEKRFDFEIYKEHEIIDFKQMQRYINVA